MRFARLLLSTVFSVSMLSIHAQSFEPSGQNLIFTGAGNVGIGTSTPDSKLHVMGNADIGDAYDPTKYGILQVLRPANQPDNKFHISFIRSGHNVSGMGYVPNSSVLGIWHANNNSVTPTMSFTFDQNVGIRTANPQAQLSLGAGPAGKRVLIYDNGPGSVQTGFGIDMSGTGRELTMFSTSTNGVDGNLSFGRRLESSGDYSEAMRIVGNGNVGIGTTNPQAKLAVNGEILSKKVRVTQIGWADYVFYSNYCLRPLSEVEQYIKQHHHLPEVPSAEEVEKNGLDVGDNQATLLKKIEELTLYIIQQNKRIEALESKIETLHEGK